MDLELGMVRINCDGLIAVAIKDSNTGGAVVDRVDLIFLDPEKTLPGDAEAHRPRIEISDANLIDWAKTSIAPEPKISPLTFPLTGWIVTVEPDGGTPGNNVEWPLLDRADPDAQGSLRVLSNQDKLLDLKKICGQGTLHPDFLTPDKKSEVVGRFVFNSGMAYTVSLKTGKFTDWSFVDKAGKVVYAQQTADSLALFVSAEKFVTFRLTSMADSTVVETLTVKCAGQVTRVNLKHACRSTDKCKKHKGAHVMQYYKMTTTAPMDPPKPVPPLSESSYCPPAMFDQA